MPAKRTPLPELPGIYKITNIQNGDFYIGSSNNLRIRRRRHLDALKAGNHPSIILQRAYNKYGKNSFEFSVVELCDLDEIRNIEQKYITEMNPKYNVLKIVGKLARVGMRHSPESIDKMKARIVSDDTKRLISDSTKLAWKNPETRHNLLKNRKYDNLGKKLNPDKVREIRMLWMEGKYSSSELAVMFGVNRYNIWAVVTYKTWKHVK